VLLAHADPGLLDEVTAAGLFPYTSAAITDPDILRHELAECRRLGYAAVDGETTPGIQSIAVRVAGPGGRVAAALAVVVESGSVDLQATLAALFTAARGISRQLGTPTVPAPVPPDAAHQRKMTRDDEQ
jgi:DNA-binding IclR family transcriptional regulator